MEKIKSVPFRPLILIVDQTMIAAAFLFTWWLSYESGLSPDKTFVPLKYHILPAVVINIYWLILFAGFGLYGRWKNSSRFDEIISVYKTITVGAIFFVMLSFTGTLNISSSKLIALGYWASLIVLAGVGRMAFRTVQRSLISRGVGLKPSIIVGSPPLIRTMVRNIEHAPALGYDVLGVIPIHEKKARKGGDIGGRKILGGLDDLHDVIQRHKVSDVLIALEFKADEEIFEIVSAAESYEVDFSILPGPSDVLAGRMMFNHLYGFPMIRILAEPMPPWEKNVKRLMDIAVSLVTAVVTFPLLIAIGIAIKLDSRGPVLYKQERVGYRGRNFKVWKFRSMVTDAEKHTGPVWAGKNDDRITRVGRIIRKLRFDEFPQLYNILMGEMSLVGPRPEREHFVEQFKKEIPYYPLRLKVKPGLTGWAQIKHNYDRSLDDVREKLKYDLYYIENMSLSMDFKIIIATVFVVLGRKGAH